MKNHALLLCLFVSVLLNTSSVSAKSFYSFSNKQSIPGDTNIMMHYNGGSPLRLNEIKMRAARHFEKQYHVDNEKWYKLDQGFVALFMEHSNINRAYYDDQGRFQFTVKNYEEKDMPAEIRKMVNDKYLGYNIFLVTEIITDEETIYEVHIKDEHTVKTLQVWDHQMKLIEDMVNAEM